MRTPAAMLILAATATLAWTDAAPAQSLWERRDPKTAYLFHDYRARQLGDVLTIVVSEVTESDAQEKRNMNKQTNTSAGLNLKGSGSVGGSGTKQFANDFNGQV